jgi:hypothetical protein
LRAIDPGAHFGDECQVGSQRFIVYFNPPRPEEEELVSLERIRRLIGACTPLWAGESEVVHTYWSSPKRSVQTDVLWLQRQCFKEFWGSGVGKYDRGGVVPGQLRKLAEKVLEVDVSLDRHEFLDVLDGIRAEYSHYCAFADLHDAIRPTGAPKIDPNQLEPWPEEDTLTAMRFRHQAEHGALGLRACKLTEGGYCTLFSAGMALEGKTGVDGGIAEACAKVYDDEFEHMLAGIAGIADEKLGDSDWRLLEQLATEQLRQRMRNAQFSLPLPEERVQQILRGEIRPLEFDFERARLGATAQPGKQ